MSSVFYHLCLVAIRLYLRVKAMSLWPGQSEIMPRKLPGMLKVLQLHCATSCFTLLFFFLDHSWEVGWNIRDEAGWCFWSLTVSCINQANFLKGQGKLLHVMQLQCWHHPRSCSEACDLHSLYCFHAQGQSHVMPIVERSKPVIKDKTDWANSRL